MRRAQPEDVEALAGPLPEESDIGFTIMGFLRESDIVDGGRPAAETPLTGSRVGSYEVGARVGRGAIGTLYRAHDVTTRRLVAIETLPASLAADRAAFGRFGVEVAARALLEHANVGAVHAVEERDGLPYLVLELVEGMTLAERLARDSPLPAEDALGIARQIAGALDAAHRKGLVHRTLTPATVRITPGGVAKVFDFGLSTMVATEDVFRAPEAPAYQAPEQVKGGAADRRSDIWAFGVILYEMLAGRLPFGVGAPVTLESMTQALAALPKRVQSDVTPLLARALAVDLADRYQAMSEAMADLGRIALRPESSPQRSTAPWVLDRDVTLAITEDVAASATVVVEPPAPEAASAAVAAAAEPGSTQEEPDFTAADALAEIRSGQRRLRDYRTRALQLTQVEDVVSRKVLADYDARYQELERKAAPLVHTVRREHERLRRVVDGVRRTDEEARLLKAEADLRHAVGEIDDAELAARARAPEDMRARCAERLATLEAIEARFTSALQMEAADAADRPADTLTRPLEVLAAPRPESVLVLDEGGVLRTFKLAATTSIGRLEGSDIRLASPRVSQRHAIVHTETSGCRLQDCGSANGTFVNGVRVSERRLEDGDRIRIGDLELVFHASAQATVCH